MDQEILAFLEGYFNSINQRFDVFDSRFDAVDRRLDETRQELRGEIQALREETMQRFERVDKRLEQVDQRFEQVEGSIRGAYVLIEDLRDKIEILAEGVTGVSERLDRLMVQEEATDQRVDALELRVRKLEVA